MKIENIPIGLLCLFTGKLLLLNTWSFENALVLLALAGVTALFQSKAKNEQIKELKEALAVHTKQFEDNKREMEQLRSHVSGLKLASGMKPQSQPRSF